jgi:hypothetical protein
MPTVNEAESPEHRKLVKVLIDYLSKQGFGVTCAAYEGYNKCEPMDERVPDVMGRNAQQLVAIGEAKTCDDLENERTDDQFRIFSNRKMISGNASGQAVPFYIGVPKTCVEQLQDRLKALGLNQKTNIYMVWLEI